MNNNRNKWLKEIMVLMFCVIWSLNNKTKQRGFPSRGCHKVFIIKLRPISDCYDQKKTTSMTSTLYMKLCWHILMISLNTSGLYKVFVRSWKCDWQQVASARRSWRCNNPTHTRSVVPHSSLRARGHDLTDRSVRRLPQNPDRSVRRLPQNP